MFGNLDNLNFGMGLKANQSQYIPTKNASFEGWSTFAEQDKAKKISWSLLGALLLILLLYKSR